MESTPKKHRSIWPLLATVFLAGIGLVSLVDSVSTSVSEVDAPAILNDPGTSVVYLIGPGREDVLALLPANLDVRMPMPGTDLPIQGQSYGVLLSEDSELPRLPIGWDIRQETQDAGWRFLLVGREQTGRGERLELMDLIRTAEVSIDGPEFNTQCDVWRFGRWTCPGQPGWVWVGPTELNIQGQRRSCIWAHPVAEHNLRIRFPMVARASRMTGRYGLSDAAADTPDGVPVELVVRAAEAERTYHAQNRRGFFPLHLSVPDPLDGDSSETMTVEVLITAPPGGRRHFCFTGSLQGIGASSDAEDGDDSGSRPSGRAFPDAARPGRPNLEGTDTGSGLGLPRLSDGSGLGLVDETPAILPQPQPVLDVLAPPSDPVLPPEGSGDSAAVLQRTPETGTTGIEPGEIEDGETEDGETEDGETEDGETENGIGAEGSGAAAEVHQ